MKFNILKRIALAGLAATILSACGNSGSCPPAANETLSLSLSAPSEYPAGVAVTAYLTITNPSNVAANNLFFEIPDLTNHTGATITVVNGVSQQPCINIPAKDSCTFPVQISANSHPGSFNVVATPNSNQTVQSKLKSTLSLNKSDSLELTANIGLTELPVNLQSGADGITFLYSKYLPANSNGTTPVDIVAVVNSPNFDRCKVNNRLNYAECLFNTINLTDQSGNLLDFQVLSTNSGTGYTNFIQDSIVTFRLFLPQGTTTTAFYAQILEDSTLVNQGTIAHPINLTGSTEGIIKVAPTKFSLIAPDSTSQIVTYTNIGNGEVSNLTIQAPAAPVSLHENTCTGSLAIGASCSVKVTSNAESAVSDTGSLKATYNNATEVLSQYDYRGLHPESGISLSAANNFSFQTNTVNTIESTQMVLTNIGNVAESSFKFSFVDSKLLQGSPLFSIANGTSGTPCAVSNDTVTTTLTAGQSCTITLTYTNSQVTPLSGLNFSVDYVYQSYENIKLPAAASKSLTYQTTQASANLNVTPNPKNFGTIIANNRDSKIEAFTLTNNGSDSTSSISIESAGRFTVQDNTCPQTLANGANCTFNIKFGPSAVIESNITESLPIVYISTTDNSQTPVTLDLNVSGVIRAALAADIQISAVSYPSSVGGDGESSTSPFHIESTNATSAIMTLTYKNVGTFAAESLTVATSESNLPAGYALDANNCNNTTLATSATCTVTLKLSTAATGNKNITLSSSVLSASWNDERGQQTPQAVIWNTGSNTLNSVYLNVYAAPYITVSSSKSSLAPGENTSMTFTLVGGYNVQDQTVSITNPNSTYITLNPSQCVVSSVAATCSAQASFDANTPATNYTFDFSNSGSVSVRPTSIAITVALPSLAVNANPFQITPIAPGNQSSISVTTSAPAATSVSVTVTVDASANEYGIGGSASSFQCTIPQGTTSCDNTGTFIVFPNYVPPPGGKNILISASASGYQASAGGILILAN